jgi:hypothetical protein
MDSAARAFEAIRSAFTDFAAAADPYRKPKP